MVRQLAGTFGSAMCLSPLGNLQKCPHHHDRRAEHFRSIIFSCGGVGLLEDKKSQSDNWPARLAARRASPRWATYKTARTITTTVPSTSAISHSVAVGWVCWRIRNRGQTADGRVWQSGAQWLSPLFNIQKRTGHDDRCAEQSSSILFSWGGVGLLRGKTGVRPLNGSTKPPSPVSLKPPSPVSLSLLPRRPRTRHRQINSRKMEWRLSFSLWS